jgi:transposase-like protein
MSRDVKSADRKEKAILALLGGATILETSVQAGVSKRTLFKWLQELEFRQRLEQEKNNVRDRDINLLKATLGDAINAARVLLGSQSERVRLTACQILLEYGFKAIELSEIVERIQKLEHMFGEDYRSL